MPIGHCHFPATCQAWANEGRAAEPHGIATPETLHSSLLSLNTPFRHHHMSSVETCRTLIENHLESRCALQQHPSEICAAEVPLDCAGRRVNLLVTTIGSCTADTLLKIRRVSSITRLKQFSRSFFFLWHLSTDSVIFRSSVLVHSTPAYS